MTAEGLHVSQRGDGPTVVLLHGLMATGDMFRWLADRLESRFRLVIPDLPGHGRSATVPGPYPVEAMAARVAATLETLGVRDAHVMGYSHGGTVAQQLTRDATHLVRSLALVAIAEVGHTMIWTHRDQLARSLAEWWDGIDQAQR